jgi:hypothetical protein
MQVTEKTDRSGQFVEAGADGNGHARRFLLAWALQVEADAGAVV